MAGEEALAVVLEAKISAYTTPSDRIADNVSAALDFGHPQHDEEEQNTERTDQSLERSVNNDEPIYPRTITKVAVGIGLALAIFLVLLLQCEPLRFLGRIRSDDCCYSYSDDIRSFQGTK